MNLAIRCLSSNPGPEPADTVARDQFSDTDLSCPIQAKPCQDSHIAAFLVMRQF